MFKLFKNTNKDAEVRQYVYEQWGAVRQMGKARYALKFSLINWTIPTFLVYSVITFLSTKLFPNVYEYTPAQALLSLLIFIVVGYLYASYNFSRFEKIYREKHPYENGPVKSKYKVPK